jgi:2-iminobutanoate/2-iminopropanoate deaminase
MPVELLQPKGIAPPIAHYSIAVRAQDRVHVAGLVATTEDGELVGRNSAREQMEYICRSLERICEQYGASLSDVVQCMVFITDPADYREADAGYAAVFGEHRPARATVVAKLVDEAYLVELTGVVIQL